MADLPSKKVLTASVAVTMISAAEEAANKMEKPLSIAIVDDGGNLLAFLRMDGAPLLSVTIAQQKAKSCAGFPIATHELWDFIKDDPMLTVGLPASGQASVLGGGYPIMVDGQLIGGIGVSGAHYTEVMEAAQAALAKLK